MQRLKKLKTTTRFISAGILSLAFSVCLTANAQPRGNTKQQTPPPVVTPLTGAQLENERWFITLEEAVKTPDKVYKLDLSNQKLKQFPIEALAFKNLQLLNLSNNKIKTLPPEIKALKCLQEINLYKNHIKALPPEIGDLYNLKRLLLANNQLYMFPIQMRGLQKLEYLDLTRTSVTFHEIDYIYKYIPKCTVKY